MKGFTVSKYITLAEALQTKILRGDYAVGEKLPTEKELAEQHNVAMLTARQGVGLLVKKGLVERRQGAGTFVVRTSQAKANIALLFGDSLSVEAAHYYRAILNRFQECASKKQWTGRVYDRLNEEVWPRATIEGQRETLLSDHRHSSFSGILEFSPGVNSVIPKDLIGRLPTALYEPPSPYSDVSSAARDFGEKAVRHLAGLGCRNIFYFCSLWHTCPSTASIDAVLDAARKLDLPAPGIHVTHYSTQGYEMERMMYHRFRELVRRWRAPRTKSPRPDALIVDDDIVMRAIAPVLLEDQIALPSGIKIFCSGNEDVRFHYPLPVIRYEISPKAIVNHLVSVLEKRIDGQLVRDEPFQPKGKLIIDE